MYHDIWSLKGNINAMVVAMAHFFSYTMYIFDFIIKSPAKIQEQFVERHVTKYIHKMHCSS